MLRITANFALSADGKITTRGNGSSGFASPADHDRLLELRARADAVIVGRHTLVADRMTLGLGSRPDLASQRVAACRPAHPARCVACFSQAPPPDHPLFSSSGGPLHLFAGPDVVARAAEFPPCELHALHSPDDLLAVLRHAAHIHGWNHVHCEGGPGLLRHFLEADAIDTLHLTITPRLFGGHAAPCLTRALPRPAFPARSLSPSPIGRNTQATFS